MNRYHIMIIAGEPSGDLHGAGLIQALLKQNPSLNISGIGGDLMAHHGMKQFYHIKHLSVMGITEVLLQFKHIKTAFNLFRQHLCTEKPDLIILIDYPGFNLKAAACAKKKSIPVLYYITPKVWAWKKSRLKKIKQYVDHAALIFPFEETLFKKEKIPCTFVGNPLLDEYIYRTEQSHDHSITPETVFVRSKSIKHVTIGILPGSRPSEIVTLLETMLNACQLIHKKYQSVTFLISCSPSIQNTETHLTAFNQIMARYNQKALFQIIPGSPRELFSRCDLLLAASGTVTLEAAICAVPMIIIYKVSAMTSFLARRFLTISHVGLPNIIAGYEVVPELIQENATAENISRKVLSMLTDPAALNDMRQALFMLRSRLGGPGASLRTARIAMQMLTNPS